MRCGCVLTDQSSAAQVCPEIGGYGPFEQVGVGLLWDDATAAAAESTSKQGNDVWCVRRPDASDRTETECLASKKAHRGDGHL